MMCWALLKRPKRPSGKSSLNSIPVIMNKKYLERVASQLNKADPNASNKDMRTFGTLGVLRNELRDRGTRFSLCQFKPEHDLNLDTLARYQKNRLRVVPELVHRFKKRIE